MQMKYPGTAALAQRAYKTTGLKTHEEFADLIQVGIRSLRRWLAGEGPASPLAAMVLRNIAAGWKPLP